MRIIAGTWRGRALLSPEGKGTRPTGDRVREALFSMLESRLGGFEGLEVADLFAGTGALGLEALSRGAARCTFVEQDRQALATLRANIDGLGAGERSEVRPIDAARVAGGPFHLVFLDPPYDSGLGRTAVEHLRDTGSLAPAALISVETARNAEVAVAGLETVAERTYGKAKLTLLRA